MGSASAAAPRPRCFAAVPACMTCSPRGSRTARSCGARASSLRGAGTDDEAHAPCLRVAGNVYRGLNISLLDGYDVAFTKLLFTEYLGVDVEYFPYPDTSSLCVRRRCPPAQR